MLLVKFLGRILILLYPFSFAVAKKFPWKEVPKYIIAQAIGAILASVLLYYLFPNSINLGETTPAVRYSPIKAAIIEFILTYILMIVIITISTGSKEIRNIAAIAVGAVILLEAMFAGPITKASMNPIRSISLPYLLVIFSFYGYIF